MSWKILTLDNDAFTDACRLLEAKVVESGFIPDMVVVSIRSGGMFVGNKMFTDIRHRSTLLQRPSTAHGKKRFVAAIVRNLPRFVQNSLRIVEARVPRQKEEVRTPYIGRRPSADPHSIRAFRKGRARFLLSTMLSTAATL